MAKETCPECGAPTAYPKGPRDWDFDGSRYVAERVAALSDEALFKVRDAWYHALPQMGVGKASDVMREALVQALNGEGTT